MANSVLVLYSIYKIQVFKYIDYLNSYMTQGITITINMEKGVLEKLKKLASKEKQKKGFLGRTITEATKRYIEEKEEDKTRERLISVFRNGFDMGKILIKHREELYDR